MKNRKTTLIALELQCAQIHFDICLKADTLGSILSKFITCWVEAKNMPLYHTLQEILMQIACRHY